MIAVGAGEPDEAVGKEEEFALLWRRPFELEEGGPFEERAARGDELEGEVDCVSLKGEEGEGLGVCVQRSV